MDIAVFLENVGEPQALALLGLALAFLFGFVAERSGFCTRSAALELVSKKAKSALPIWLLGFSAAIFAVQALIYFGQIDVTETRFFATPLSLSGALIGGGLFGIGMALARGCSSRLLVLGASGNLRALTTIIIMSGAAWFTLNGFLIEPRDLIGSLLSTASIGTNDFVAFSNLGAIGGVVLGLIAFIAAIFYSVRVKLSKIKALGGITIGGVIAAGWYNTYAFSTQVFEPIQAESLSFIRPTASALNYISSAGDVSYLSLDIGLVAGVLIGALVSSILFGSFKVQKFGDEGAPHFMRYAAGGILMGFGGILAVGCTIGAGFTGGSVLSVSSLVALSSMIGFGLLTEKLLLVFGEQSHRQLKIIPAE